MVKVVFLLVMGIPASGKTTLCRTLQTKLSNKFQCVHIPFDDIIEEKHIFNENWNPDDKRWKTCRSAIYFVLDRLIASIISGMPSELVDCSFIANIPPNQESHVCMDVGVRFMQCLQQYDLPKGDSRPFIIMLDDNFFYSSMRHVFYTLAKSRGISYAVVFCNCDEEVALSRDASRKSPVGKSIISKMYNRLEPPHPENKWERFSLSLNHEDYQSDVWRIDDLIITALEHPFDTYAEDSALKERLASQHGTASNFTHQVDIELRLIVRKILSEKDSEWRSNYGRSVADLRKKVLLEFKTNESPLLKNLKGLQLNLSSNDYQKHILHELNQHFLLRLNEIVP